MLGKEQRPEAREGVIACEVHGRGHNRWTFALPNLGDDRPGRDPIMVSVITNTRGDYFPRAYGMAFPYEGVHLTIFYDRIRRIQPDLVVPLLAHVLAHEIVHTLTATDVHAENGLMKLRWSQTDLRQMAVRPLPISNTDMFLLQLGIDCRHARLAAMANNLASTGSIPAE